MPGLIRVPRGTPPGRECKWIPAFFFWAGGPTSRRLTRPGIHARSLLSNSLADVFEQVFDGDALLRHRVPIADGHSVDQVR